MSNQVPENLKFVSVGFTNGCLQSQIDNLIEVVFEWYEVEVFWSPIYERELWKFFYLGKLHLPEQNLSIEWILFSTNGLRCLVSLSLSIFSRESFCCIQYLADRESVLLLTIAKLLSPEISTQIMEINRQGSDIATYIGGNSTIPKCVIPIKYEISKNMFVHLLSR